MTTLIILYLIVAALVAVTVSALDWNREFCPWTSAATSLLAGLGWPFLLVYLGLPLLRNWLRK